MLEDGVASVRVRFRASETIEAPFQRITPVMLEAEVVPAKIRGRFYKAEERSTVPSTPLEGGGLESRWLGPAYAPGPQTGIEFTESALVDLPRFKIGGGVGAGVDLKGEPDIAAYHPNLPFKVKKSIISPTVKANASVKFEAESALNIDHTDDSIRADETKFTLTAGGGVGVLLEADVLRAAYRAIAATGPWAAALAAVRESELLEITLFCEPRGGAAWEQTLVTRPRSTVTPVRPAGINQEGIDKSLKTFGIGEEYIPIVDQAKRETIGLIGGKTGVKFSVVGGVL